MQSNPISVEGFNKLKRELEELKKERPEVIQAIKDAREEGDIRENAGYEAAKERQGMLEARIRAGGGRYSGKRRVRGGQGATGHAGGPNP